MIKIEAVLLDGQVINIGPWDYLIERVVVEPGEHDVAGNLVKEPVYENRVTNSLPEGAQVTEVTVDRTADGGWFAVDYDSPHPPSPTDVLGAELASLKLLGISQQQTIDALGVQLTSAKLEIIKLKGASDI